MSLLELRRWQDEEHCALDYNTVCSMTGRQDTDRKPDDGSRMQDLSRQPTNAVRLPERPAQGHVQEDAFVLSFHPFASAAFLSSLRLLLAVVLRDCCCSTHGKRGRYAAEGY